MLESTHAHDETVTDDRINTQHTIVLIYINRVGHTRDTHLSHTVNGGGDGVIYVVLTYGS